MYEGQRVLYLRLYFVYAHTYGTTISFSWTLGVLFGLDALALFIYSTSCLTLHCCWISLRKTFLYANMREGIFAFFKFFFCNMVSHRSLLHVPSGISLFREKAATSVAIGYVGRKQRASLIGKKPHKEKGGREKKKSLGIKIGRLDGSNQLATLISLFALFLLDFPI